MVRKNGAVVGLAPVAGYTITVRAQYPNKPGMLGRLATTIGDQFIGEAFDPELPQAGINLVIQDLSRLKHQTFAV